MPRPLLPNWRASFFTGLAVVLPVVISVGVVLWLFGTVANFTDTLLFFLPRSLTHANGGRGPMLWHWSAFALLLAVVMITLIGAATRLYLGRKLLQWMDELLLRVPLLNKIYGALKQLNEAFASNDKSAFKQVVLVEFPRAGQWSVGFLTSERHPEAELKLGRDLVSVVIPTTPNPTSGFLVLVPADSVVRLDMSVADGIKYIISLGAVAPEFPHGAPPPPAVSPNPFGPRA